MVLEELLAPAGSYEVLVIAVNAGADAVYIAGQNYGARAYAKNFTMDEIEKAVTYRDMPLMTALTVALIVLGFRRKGDGRLNRIAGAILLAIYVGYLALLVIQAKG